jgi:hypothetical protein
MTSLMKPESKSTALQWAARVCTAFSRCIKLVLPHTFCACYIDHRWPHSIVFFVIRLPVVLAKQACSYTCIRAANPTGYTGYGALFACLLNPVPDAGINTKSSVESQSAGELRSDLGAPPPPPPPPPPSLESAANWPVSSGGGSPRSPHTQAWSPAGSTDEPGAIMPAEIMEGLRVLPPQLLAALQVGAIDIAAHTQHHPTPLAPPPAHG